MHPHLKFALRIVRDSCFLALGLTLLLSLIADNMAFAEIRDIFIETALYASIITAMAEVIFHKLAPRVAACDSGTQWTVFVLTMLAISAVGSLLGSLIVIAINLEPTMSFWQLLSTSFKLSAFLALIIGVNEAQFERLQGQLEDTKLKLQAQELERERALKLASEARLAALESRLHPHFLFNTLNSISSLIPTDPARAERLIERIAALLRFSLEPHKGGLVELEQEMSVVRDYLEIEQARLGDRLRYRLDAGAGLNAVHLPPLAVQTLVENSIKYAVAPNRQGGEIRVQAARNNGDLQIEVADSGPGFGPGFSVDALPAGHGLDNLRHRLDVLFGKAADLQVARADGWTTVRFRVPA